MTKFLSNLENKCSCIK